MDWQKTRSCRDPIFSDLLYGRRCSGVPASGPQEQQGPSLRPHHGDGDDHCLLRRPLVRGAVPRLSVHHLNGLGFGLRGRRDHLT